VAKQVLQPRAEFESGLRAAQNKDIESALKAFFRAAEGLDEHHRGSALYNLGTLRLEAGQVDEAIVLLEQALILMPGDEIIRDNLLLALAHPSMLTNDGSGTPNQQEDDKGDEGDRMSPQQAQRLIDSVRLDPTAPPIEATIRPPTVLKEW
jgi:tetratricopeptide (TPR) repeat protein